MKIAELLEAIEAQLANYEIDLMELPEDEYDYVRKKMAILLVEKAEQCCEEKTLEIAFLWYKLGASDGANGKYDSIEPQRSFAKMCRKQIELNQTNKQ